MSETALSGSSLFLNDKLQSIKTGELFLRYAATSSDVSKVWFWVQCFNSLYYATKLRYPTSQLGPSHLRRWHTHLLLFGHTKYLSLPKSTWHFLQNMLMRYSKLKLNAEETGFLIIDTPTQRRKQDGFSRFIFSVRASH